MPESFTHKYIPRIEQRENNLFVEEYYSSTDTKIILDGIEQTEIGYISYAVQEQLKPLYGYSSRTYDDVAIGNRIVTGAFKVPIKNPNTQTQLSTIIEATAKDASKEDEDEVSEVDNHNAEQEQLKSGIEWIDSSIRDIISGGGSTYYPQQNDTDNEYYQYKSKLQELGLKDASGNKITMSSSEASVKSAIQKLQAENNIDGATGELTEQTKALIDDMVFDKWEELEVITLPASTKVYLGPGDDYSYSELYADTKAQIIDKSLGNWWLVHFEGKNDGYIKRPGGDS